MASPMKVNAWIGALACSAQDVVEHAADLRVAGIAYDRAHQAGELVAARHPRRVRQLSPP